MPLLLLVLFLSSCSTCCFDRSEVVELVNERLNLESENLILPTFLNADSAMTYAVYNHPWYRAKLAEIGVSESELLQAGLLPNPLIDGYVRFSKNTKTNFSFSLLENLIGVILTPVRSRIAYAELQEVKWKAAYEWIDRALNIQRIVFEVQSVEEELDYLTQIQELLELKTQLSGMQLQSQNIGSMDFHLKQIELSEAKVAILQKEQKAIALREQLAEELGLCSSDGLVLEKLPDLPEADPAQECLEEYALENRLDLESLAWSYEVNRLKSPLATPWARSDLALGISYEREPEGTNVIGPAFALELPIFDYGQAERRRQSFEALEKTEGYASQEISIRAQVRKAYQQLLNSRHIVSLYYCELLPIQTKLVSESEIYVNSMALNLYELIERKKKELELQIQAIQAKRSYWTSRIELDKALGVHCG